MKTLKAHMNIFVSAKTVLMPMAVLAFLSCSSSILGVEPYWWENSELNSHESSALLDFYRNHENFSNRLKWDFSFSFDRENILIEELVLLHYYVHILSFKDLERFVEIAKRTPNDPPGPEYSYLNACAERSYRFNKVFKWFRKSFSAAEIGNALDEWIIFSIFFDMNMNKYHPGEYSNQSVYSKLDDNEFDMKVEIRLDQPENGGDEENFNKLVSILQNSFPPAFRKKVEFITEDNFSLNILFQKSGTGEPQEPTLHWVSYGLTNRLASLSRISFPEEPDFIIPEGYMATIPISDYLEASSNVFTANIIEEKAAIDKSEIKKIKIDKDYDSFPRKMKVSVELTDKGAKDLYDYTSGTGLTMDLAFMSGSINLFSVTVFDPIPLTKSHTIDVYLNENETVNSMLAYYLTQ